MTKNDHNQPHNIREENDKPADASGCRPVDARSAHSSEREAELLKQIDKLTALNRQLQQAAENARALCDNWDNLLSSLDIAALFLDRDMKIRSFAFSVQQFFNLTTADIGRPFGEISSTLDDPALVEDINRVMSGTPRADIAIRSVKGAVYLRRILPCKSQSGVMDGVVITYRDAIDPSQTDDDFIRAKGFYDSIIATLREPLLILDKDFKIVRASQSFHNMFRTTPEEIDDDNLFTLQDGKWNQTELCQLLERVLPDHTTVENYQLSIETATMGSRTMVLNARRLAGGPADDDFILLAFEDMTDLLSVQHDLEERQARLRAIVDAAPEAIVTTDEKGIISSFSPAAELMMGYTAQEVIGQNVNILMAEPDRSKHDDYIARYLRTGEKRIIGVGREMQAIHKDGQVIPVRLTIAEWWLDGGRHFTGVMHDLTEDMKRRNALNRAQRMEAVGQLMGGMAHDFNNLLTIIIGNLELLEMQIEDEQERALLGEALDASNLGAQLTSQLLAFSRNQALTPRAVDLNDLVQAMMPILARTLGSQVKVETMLANDLRQTLTDPGQIESAILNLAINARDAMPDGGTLSITTRNTFLEADYVATQVDLKPGPYVALCVTDTGHGMASDVVERAFEPFFTTKGPGGGSGLGLSMVYGFAKQSGGHLAIYSEVSHGTTVSLYLPQSSDGAMLPRATVPPRSSDIALEKILVVEDDPRVRRLTVIRLNELGYNVVAAVDGPSALDIIKADNEISLVLSDIVMPGGISGVALADRVQETNPSLKILLATGYADATHTGEIGKPKDYRVLRKPYSITELAETLRALLDGPPDG